jgi:hypothetical protein
MILYLVLQAAAACTLDERQVNDMCLPTCRSFSFNSTSRSCLLYQVVGNETYEETHDGYNYDSGSEATPVPWLYIVVAAEVFVAAVFLAVYTCCKRRKYWAEAQARDMRRDV